LFDFVEIWYAGALWVREGGHIYQTGTGREMRGQQPPLWNIVFGALRLSRPQIDAAQLDIWCQRTSERASRKRTFI